MKRFFTYGFLLCLLISMGRMVGYGQPSIVDSNPSYSGLTIGSTTSCNANSWVFTSSGQYHEIAIGTGSDGWQGLKVDGEEYLKQESNNHKSYYKIMASGTIYVMLMNDNGTKKIIADRENPCGSDPQKPKVSNNNPSWAGLDVSAVTPCEDSYVFSFTATDPWHPIKIKNWTNVTVTGGILQCKNSTDVYENNTVGTFYVKLVDNNGTKSIIVQNTQFTCGSTPTPDPDPDPSPSYLVTDGCGKKLVVSGDLEIAEGDVLDVTNIEIQSGGHLVNKGTINIKNCSTGDYADFNFASNVFANTNKFTNASTGIIRCNNFNGEIDVYNSKDFEFVNDGSIICVNNFKYNIGDHHKYSSNCATYVKATNIKIATNTPIILNGYYGCSNMEIYDQNGGHPVNFGTNCTSSSDVHVDTKLKITGNGTSIVIDGSSTISTIEGTSNNTSKITINGKAIIGEVSGNLGIETTSNSLLILCYNPTIGAADNFLKTHNGVGGSIQGTVIYRVSKDESSDHNYWRYPNASPIDEGDISGTPILKANKVSYQECMDGTTSFLSIDDDPFLPKNKEIKKLYIDNPCSEEYESHKIQLRELGGKWFRVINGELIYCENDNE